MDQQIFSVGNVLNEDLKKLRELYGDNISDIRHLDVDEVFAFSGQDTISPSLFVQTLYKFRSKNEYPPEEYIRHSNMAGQYTPTPPKGYLIPANLQKVINRYVEKIPALRTCYYRSTNGEFWAIEQKFSQPELSFRVLQEADDTSLDEKIDSILLADRHRPFDLAKPPLLRISTYRISFRKYAILITQPHLFASKWDPMLFLRELLPKEELEPYTPHFTPSFAKLFIDTEQKKRKPIIEYWTKELEDIPEKPQLPGYFPHEGWRRTIANYRLNITRQEVDSIKEHIVATDRSFWIAFLSSAWAMTLQCFNDSSDTHFPLLMQFRNAHLSTATSNDMHNAIPMRMKTDLNATVRDNVKHQLVKLIGAQPMGRLTRLELSKITGQQSLYNHIVSFQGFWTESTPFSQDIKTDGISQSSINLTDTGKDIALYFHFNGQEILIDIFFNELAISYNSIERIANQYHIAIISMLKHWNTPIIDIAKDTSESAAPHIDSLSTVEIIGNKLTQIPMLSSLSQSEINEIAKVSRMYQLGMDDSVLALGYRQDHFLFLAHGKVIRYMENEEKWLNPVNVIKNNGIINESALTDDVCDMYACVSSLEASIISVPKQTIKSIMAKNPKFAEKFYSYILQQLKIYQKRWINT